MTGLLKSYYVGHWWCGSTCAGVRGLRGLGRLMDSVEAQPGFRPCRFEDPSSWYVPTSPILDRVELYNLVGNRVSVHQTEHNVRSFRQRPPGRPFMVVNVESTLLECCHYYLLDCPFCHENPLRYFFTMQHSVILLYLSVSLVATASVCSPSQIFPLSETALRLIAPAPTYCLLSSANSDK